MPDKRPGRPAASSREEVARCAMELFEVHGYGGTSVSQIAERAGISRRTFFSYFASKSEAFWWEFDAALTSLEERLAASDPETDPLRCVLEAAVGARDYPPSERPRMRRQVEELDHNADLVAHSVRQNQRWADVIAWFLRERGALGADELLPQLVGAAFIAVGNVATRAWAMSSGTEPLSSPLREALMPLYAAYAEPLRSASDRHRMAG